MSRARKRSRQFWQFFARSLCVPGTNTPQQTRLVETRAESIIFKELGLQIRVPCLSNSSSWNRCCWLSMPLFQDVGKFGFKKMYICTCFCTPNSRPPVELYGNFCTIHSMSLNHCFTACTKWTHYCKSGLKSLKSPEEKPFVKFRIYRWYICNFFSNNFF